MRIGVVGAASIFLKKMLPLFEEDSRFDLVGVARRKIDSNQCRFKQRIGYKSFSKEEVDMVYIPLPNNYHYPIAKYYLELGVNVLIEKPSTTSYESTLELTRIANDNQVFFKESFQWFHHKRSQKLREICDRYKPYLINVVFTIPHLDKNNIRYKKELNGGACYDLAAYPCSVMTYLFPKDNFLLQDHFVSWKDNFNVDIGGYGAFMNKSKGLLVNFYYAFGKSYESRLSLHTMNGRYDVNQPFTANRESKALIINEFNTNIEEVSYPDCHFKSMLEDILKAKESHIKINERTLKQASLLNQIIRRI